jgi:hypothetical protein
VLVLVAESGFANGAFAQSGADDERARQLFESAMEAADRAEYGRARDLFRRSLEISLRPATAENLALVLRALGETVEAVEVLDAIDRGDFGDVAPEHLEVLRARRAETAAEVGAVLLTVRRGQDADVRVDGSLVPNASGSWPQRLRVDGGRHVIVVSTPDGRSVEDRVDVPPGGEAALTITLPPPSPPPSRSEDEGTSVLASPWTWIIAGLLVAGAVTLAVVLATSGGQEPVSDPVWGRRLGLSF